jgi:hypothetical protein
MNLTKKTILALGVLAAASVSFAQNNSTTGAAPVVGLLGQSYSEVNFGVSDIKNVSRDLYSVGVSANVPATAYLDLGAGYTYGWMRGTGHANTIGATATAYKSFNGVKPFVGAGLGYQWTQVGGTSDDSSIWGLSAGVEIPVGVVTITPEIVYADDFRNSTESTQQVSYGVEANYWVTKTVSVFGGVAYSDVRNSSIDSWDYTVGARFKF